MDRRRGIVIVIRVREVEVRGGRGQAADATSGRQFSVAVVGFPGMGEVVVGVQVALLVSLWNLQTKEDVTNYQVPIMNSVSDPY